MFTSARHAYSTSPLLFPILSRRLSNSNSLFVSSVPYISGARSSRFQNNNFPRSRFLSPPSPPPHSLSSKKRMGSLSAADDVALKYPVVRRDNSVVDDYHGVLVSDPYRWLEDPEAKEVKDFVQSQVKLTESVLEKCETREKLREMVTKLFDHPRYFAPFRRGDKYFYFHNTGLQAQDVLYVQGVL